MANEKKKPHRGWWLSIMKAILKIFIRKPKFEFVGEDKFIEQGSIVLSNHVGKTGPLSLECYLKHKFRFWGTYEMNASFKEMYRYLSYDFYHIRKHWKLFWARAFSVIASPFVWLFYRGLNLIPTYQDARMRKSLEESVKTIQDKTSIVIFPEDSIDGYLDKLKEFFSGFYLLANACYKKGLDILIYVCYFKTKGKRRFIIDKPIKFSELLAKGLNRDQIAQDFCDRSNALSAL